MQITTGVDIVSVSRIATLLDKKKSLFVERIFTEAEIDYCESKVSSVQSYAARFSAKEAFIKAFPDKSVSFDYKDIEVKKDGKLPCISLVGEKDKYMEDMSVSLSIAHEKEYAVANVVIYKR